MTKNNTKKLPVNRKMKIESMSIYDDFKMLLKEQMRSTIKKHLDAESMLIYYHNGESGECERVILLLPSITSDEAYKLDLKGIIREAYEKAFYKAYTKLGVYVNTGDCRAGKEEIVVRVMCNDTLTGYDVYVQKFYNPIHDLKFKCKCGYC